MNHYFRFFSILLFLIVSSGCSNHQLPFKDLDTIIAQLERENRQEPKSGTIVEHPENSRPFQKGTSFSSPVGMETNGSFAFKDTKISFRYPAVEGKYYVVTPLTDKDGKISLLVTLHTDTSASQDVPHESTTPETP